MSTSVSSFGYPSMRQAVQRPAGAHLRMTSRGRAVLLTLVTAPLVVAALALSLNAGGATATDSAGVLKTVTVSSGESLWQVALTVAPNTDPREVIADIMSLNNLTSADVQPGQQLDIPAQYDH
ncbi:MAG TPA: LysM peptidoglycan-binding domain-containing protein [Galbitalea sp.]